MGINRNKVMHEILDVLSEGGNLLIEWMENPHAQRRRVRGILTHDEWEALFGEQKRKAALKRLRKKKWLEDRKKGNDVEFDLSHEALVELLKMKISNAAYKIGDQETMVVFDIPEAARKARQRWRRFLKELGFKQVQLSVWSCAKDVGGYVQSLIAVLGIKKWVKVYGATLFE